MTGPFAAHSVRHAAPRTPIFRRSLRLPWRKPAVPAGYETAGAATALINDAAPVLGDQWVSDVREQWNAWHDGTPAARHAMTEPTGFPAVPTFTPYVPAAEVGTSGRRTLSGVENLTAAGGAPGAGRARSSPSAPGAVRHADAMHATAARFLPPRPVNGRNLGTQPRLRPVRALDAERDAAREAGERARVRYQAPPPALLRQLLEGIRKL